MAVESRREKDDLGAELVEAGEDAGFDGLYDGC